MNNTTLGCNNIAADGDSSLLVASSIINGMVVLVVTYVIIVLILSIHLLKIKIKDILKQSSKEKKQVAVSTTLCLVLAISVLLRCIIFFIDITSKYHATINNGVIFCLLTQTMNNLLPTVGIVLIYKFFWERQQIFYGYPELESLFSVGLRWLTSVVNIIWSLYCLIVIICYFVYVQYSFDEKDGCVIGSNNASALLYGVIVSRIIAMVLMAITLLLLLIYPVLKQKSWRKIENGSKCLLNRLKKVIVLTAITALTDIAAAVVTLTVGGLIGNLIINLNILMNLLAAIGCYDNWKHVLCPWKSKLKKDRSNAMSPAW